MEKSNYNSLKDFKTKDIEAYNAICSKNMLKDICENFGWELHETLFDVSSILECVEIGKRRKIISSMMWRKKHKEIGEKEGKKLPSEPWKTFNLKGGFIKFTELLGGTARTYDVSSILECVEIGKRRKITSARIWTKKYKEIGEKEGKKLPSRPWLVFKLEGGFTKFTKLLGDTRTYGVSSILECVEIGKRRKITSARIWTKKYKEIGEKEGKKLPANPWKKFNLEGGFIKFTELLGGTTRTYDVSSILECVEIGKRRKITSARIWTKKYKEIGEKEGKKLPSHPWLVFKLEGGPSKFTELLGGTARTYDVSSILECVEIGKRRKITSARIWTKKYKEIGEKEGKKLPSEPWKTFNLEGGSTKFSLLLKLKK